MSEKQRSFYKRVKNCFVLFKPLDKKLLEQYMKQNEADLKTRRASSCSEDKYEKWGESRNVFTESVTKNHIKSKHVKELNGENFPKSPSTDDFDFEKNKMKLKTKPLRDAEDANELNRGNFKENILAGTEFSTKDNKLSLTFNAPNSDLVEQRKSQILKNHSNTHLSSGLSVNKSATSPELNLMLNDFGSGNEKSGKEPNHELFSRNSLENVVQETANITRHFKSEPEESEEFSKSDKRHFTNDIKLMMNNNNNNNIDFAIESDDKTFDECTESNIFQIKSDWEDSAADFIKTEAKSAVVLSQEFEDEEYDPRDESEDDRATIIFDGNLDHKMVNNETLCENVEKKIVRVKKKLQKKKMINRKKQTFVKFKRKRSMMGRNLSKVKKVRKKNLGTSNQKQQSSEKAKTFANEDCVKEVCHLVKRLHELYRIILQLREDLPKNSEHADHFIKTIKVQQENFLQEIRKNQKIITRGYEKMLNFYGNAKKVCWEIGKRTSLSKEEVVSVISRCTLVEETCEEGKMMKEISQEKSSSQSGSRDSSEKLFDDEVLTTLPEVTVEETNDTRPVAVENTTKESPRNTSKQYGANNTSDSVSGRVPFSSRRTRKTLLPTPVFEPQIAGGIPTGESNLTTHLPSQQFCRVNLPLTDNNQEQWVDYSKPRLNFWQQKNYNLKAQAMMKDSRAKHFPQNLTLTNPHDIQMSHSRIPARPMHSQPSNIWAQYHEDDFFNHCVRPRVATNYSPNNAWGYFQVPNTSGRNGSLPIPALMDINTNFTEYNRMRLPVNQCPHIVNSNSSVLTSNRPLSVIESLENPEHMNNFFQNSKSTKLSYCFTRVPSNSRRRYQPSSLQRFEHSVPRVPNQENCPLETTLMNTTRFIQPNSNSTQNQAVTGVLTNSTEMNTSTNNLKRKQTNDLSSEECERCFLDPTVPQKLTMKNCRLQAGPLIEVKTERPKSEVSDRKTLHRMLPEETLFKSDIKVESFDQKETNSRVYMCAQNGCKNTGVRICKGCTSVIYCSESCQLKHWTQKHKTECHQLKELRG